jgi:SAM-dependent methyltransferase
MKILEVGSRNVTGINLRRLFDKAEYSGFDIYPGENVDVVGDAHRLSEYFEPEQFDLIFSSAVFEHLAMPWIVAEEIAILLKTGGQVFIETHFSFGSHERPWNFFQFSDMGLRALFNPALGFQVIDTGMSNPMAGWFMPQSDPYLQCNEVQELYCHSQILCQKTRPFSPIRWRDIDMETITGHTHYPGPPANR